MFINVFEYTETVWKEPHFANNDDDDKDNNSPHRAQTR